MNEKEAWNIFSLTGSVDDYLRYKDIQHTSKKQTVQGNTINESNNRRTDNQTTEYR